MRAMCWAKYQYFKLLQILQCPHEYDNAYQGSWRPSIKAPGSPLSFKSLQFVSDLIPRLLPSAWTVSDDPDRPSAASKPSNQQSKPGRGAASPRRRPRLTATPAVGVRAPAKQRGVVAPPAAKGSADVKKKTSRTKTKVKTKKKKKKKKKSKKAAASTQKMAAKGPFCQKKSCGKQQPKEGFLFCKYCGEQIVLPGDDDESTVDRFCTKCGCALQHGLCPKCQGDQLGDQQESGAPMDRRRTILFDAGVAQSVEGLRRRRGTLLYRASEDKGSSSAARTPKIAWHALKLQREVGEGGYAVVHLAEWRGDVVAVKELKIVESDDSSKRDFENEIRVLTSLENDNITKFHGACIEGDRLGYVMEYCAQGSLSFLLVRDDIKMDWQLRLQWLGDVANAVNYLHCLQPKIIHRDLKSDNVLVDAAGRAKICDFGLCKAKSLAAKLSQKNQSSSLRGGGGGNKSQRQSFVQRRMSVIQFSQEAGTPQYMAPELIRRAPYSERVDAYSFGIFAWEVAARQWAHMDLDPLEIMTQVKLRKLRPQIDPWVPKSFQMLLKTCWHERAERRPTFERIEEMIARLKEESVDWEQPLNCDPISMYEEEEIIYEEEEEIIYEEEEIIYEEEEIIYEDEDEVYEVVEEVIYE